MPDYDVDTSRTSTAATFLERRRRAIAAAACRDGDKAQMRGALASACYAAFIFYC